MAKAFFLGKATNNVAEYTALLKGLEAARQMNVQKVLIRSDSELMVRQIKGEYKVKNPGLAEIYSQCMELLLAHFATGRSSIFPAKKINKADALVNRALDAQSDIEEKADSSGKSKTGPARHTAQRRRQNDDESP